MACRIYNFADCVCFMDSVKAGETMSDSILSLEALIKRGGKVELTDSKGTQYTIERNSNYFLLVYPLERRMCLINFMRLDDAIRYISGAASKNNE